MGRLTIIYTVIIVLDYCHCFVANSSFCVARKTNRMLNLECDVHNDPASSPIPQPTPTRSWYKDGNLVYTAEIGVMPDVTELFMNNTILQPGVLEPQIISLTTDGQILYNIHVDNISQPMLLLGGTTINKAREQVFDFLLGIWTCVVSNSFGTTFVNYMISECGKYT